MNKQTVFAGWSWPWVIVVVSCLMAGILLWVLQVVFTQPDLGVDWADGGRVFYAKPNSPIRSGDVVLTIDGVPRAESTFPFFSWYSGDVIALELERNGETILLNIPFVEPAPWPILWQRLALVIVAIGFAISGGAVGLYLPAERGQGVLFFFWCQAIALTLALGTAVTSSWVPHMSVVAAWWIVPLAVHFHLQFPVANRIGRKTYFVLWIFYLIPLIGLNRVALAAGWISRADLIFQVASLLFLAWIAFGLLAVSFLLVRSYFTVQTSTAKRQVGVVAISGFLGLQPLLWLSIVPSLAFGTSFLAYEISFLFLIAVPVGYIYAIKEYQFIRLEQYMSRGIATSFVVIVLAFTYTVINTQVSRRWEGNFYAAPAVNLVTSMLLVLIYPWAHKRLQTFVDYLLYGGWYDYRSAVGELTYKLEAANSLEKLAQTLGDSIQQTMRVYWTCLLLPHSLHQQSVHVSGQPADLPFLSTIQLSDLKRITTYLQMIARPADSAEIRQVLAMSRLNEVEKQLLTSPAIRLWLPILGREEVGLLLLGSKYGGELFDHNDMDILAVVLRQASTAFQNAQLIVALARKAHENEQFQKEIVRTREEERKRIARELHDEIIQPMVGFRYQISRLQSALNDSQAQEQASQLQQSIGDLIQATRHLCQDLRPPALDLGLVPSIRSAVSQFERLAEVKVDLQVEGDRQLTVHEDVALCLYRCTNEALVNIAKHAQAQEVQVQLTIEPTHIQLKVKDDGRGFAVPEHLGSLMEQNHFGVVGMRERFELLGGSFQLNSLVGQGTTIEAQVPL
jgi:signal transduction histidine kinase